MGLPHNHNYFTTSNIIAGIIGLIGIIWLCCEIAKMKKINIISLWPKVNALVLNSMVMPLSGKHFGLGQQFVTGPILDNSARYYPRVLYEYRLGNRIYRSEHVFYGKHDTYNAADINALMSQMRPGSTIPVYYNPYKLSESYIYPGVKSWTGIIISCVLILIAIVIAYRHNRTDKTAKLHHGGYQETSVTSPANIGTLGPDVSETSGTSYYTHTRGSQEGAGCSDYSPATPNLTPDQVDSKKPNLFDLFSKTW